MGLTLVLDFFGYTVAAAAMTDLCVKSLLGLKLSTWESLGAAWRIWLPLLGIFGLKLSIAFLLAVWALVPLVGWFTGPGALAIFLGNIIFLAVPVLILEKQSPMRSLWRAWRLVRGRYCWMVAFGIILFIFSQLGITGLKYLMIFLTSALIQVLQPALLDRIPNVVTHSFIFAIDSLTNLLYLPLYAMGAVTAYLYLRNKSEALDLIVALEGSPASSDLMAEVKVSDSTASRWPLTWREGGKFAIMTLSGTVGIAIFYTILFGSILAVAIFIIIFNNR